MIEDSSMTWCSVRCPDDVPQCNVIAPDRGVVCTREKSHDGAHHAHGNVLLNGQEKCFARWDDKKFGSRKQHEKRGGKRL